MDGAGGEFVEKAQLPAGTCGPSGGFLVAYLIRSATLATTMVRAAVPTSPAVDLLDLGWSVVAPVALAVGLCLIAFPGGGLVHYIRRRRFR